MPRLEEEVAQLTYVVPAELRRRWAATTDKPLPRISAKLLRLALAWEMQARAYGGMSRRTSQKLAQLGGGLSVTREVQPGMRLVREWQGKVHVVTISEDKVISWNEREWQSLSEVARAITGTRWSGPAFFGLKQKKAAAA